VEVIRITIIKIKSLMEIRKIAVIIKMIIIMRTILETKIRIMMEK